MQDILTTFFKKYDLDSHSKLAVGVSGGADSMALAHILSQTGKEIHVMTVDHGLREGAKSECQKVEEIVGDWPNVTHHILEWQHDGVESGVQESARAARYDLMAQKCLELGVEVLFIAHHQDDQAETFLMRLSSGSGLDGLACMESFSDKGDIKIARPLLGVSHDDLIMYCQENNIEWIEDPSNKDDNYERVRMRKAREVLEAEGLSNKRLSKTAERLSRGREALRFYTELAWESVTKTDESQVSIDLKAWQEIPEDIQLRVVIKAFQVLHPSREFTPRMEKVESLVDALNAPNEFKRTTLGKCVIERKKDKIAFYKENG